MLHLGSDGIVTFAPCGQGDEEKKLKLPVSPGFEREGHSKVNSQLGFIKFMVKPLYDAMDLLVTAAQALPVLSAV